MELNKELLRASTFTRRRHWENKKSKRISRYLYKHYSLSPHSIRWCFMAADNSQKSPVPSLTDMGRDDSTLYIQQPKNGFTKQLLSLNRLRTNPICCLYPPQAHSPISSSALAAVTRYESIFLLVLFTFPPPKRVSVQYNAVLSSISHRLFPSTVRFDCNSHIFNPLKKKITIKIQILTISAPLFQAIHRPFIDHQPPQRGTSASRIELWPAATSSVAGCWG